MHTACTADRQLIANSLSAGTAAAVPGPLSVRDASLLQSAAAAAAGASTADGSAAALLTAAADAAKTAWIGSDKGRMRATAATAGAQSTAACEGPSQAAADAGLASEQHPCTQPGAIIDRATALRQASGQERIDRDVHHDALSTLHSAAPGQPPSASQRLRPASEQRSTSEQSETAGQDLATIESDFNQDPLPTLTSGAAARQPKPALEWTSIPRGTAAQQDSQQSSRLGNMRGEGTYGNREEAAAQLGLPP